jgi:hypothetical protein
MTGAELIAAERERQVSEEGWSEAHDDQHRRGELVTAACCYAAGSPVYGAGWPWDMNWWRQADSVRNLTKAGALIAAEIDRLQRLCSTPAKT